MIPGKNWPQLTNWTHIDRHETPNPSKSSEPTTLYHKNRPICPRKKQKSQRHSRKFQLIDHESSTGWVLVRSPLILCGGCWVWYVDTSIIFVGWMEGPGRAGEGNSLLGCDYRNLGHETNCCIMYRLDYSNPSRTNSQPRRTNKGFRLAWSHVSQREWRKCGMKRKRSLQGNWKTGYAREAYVYWLLRHFTAFGLFEVLRTWFTFKTCLYIRQMYNIFCSIHYIFVNFRLYTSRVNDICQAVTIRIWNRKSWT